jgi:hypothetical protein
VAAASVSDITLGRGRGVDMGRRVSESLPSII